MPTATRTDRIEEEVLLRAPRDRVWHALTDTGEFGRWFGAVMQGTFVPGAPARGRITEPGYEQLTLEMTVERMEPPRLFSWRWHPYAVDPEHDYSDEPTTLVECQLTDAPRGTRLRITESGFDRLPADRRSQAFDMNAKGWSAQMQNIARHLAAR